MNSSMLRTSKSILDQLRESTQSQQVTSKAPARKSISDFFSSAKDKAERAASRPSLPAAGTTQCPNLSLSGM